MAGKINILSAVWGSRRGFVSLPFKDGTRWHEAPLEPWDGTNLPDYKELHVDRYFCPVVFSKPQRRKEYALPTNVLWADLDPTHPDTCRLKPSIAWESSPGRYQALWFLSTEVQPDDAAAMSKRIAYADGGDHSGWDLTQVLRIPGTRNYKYDSAPEGKLLWAKRFAYSVSEILAAYPPVNGDATPGKVVDDWPTVPEATIQTTIQNLPLGIKNRLTRNTAGADRSKEFQLLARDLLKFGVLPEVAAHIMQRSTWNKFAGRPTEHQDILRQISQADEVVKSRQQDKIQRKAATEELTLAEQMQVHKWGQFLQIPTHLRWLVDDAWVDQSVGFISGRSKSYKTWIALDLALSVVSGGSFLGRYPVRRTGPVLLIQEEDPSAVLQDRLRLIGKSKDMLPSYTLKDDVLSIEYTDYPLHVINLQGFNLQVEEKVAQVRRLIAEINPVMVILDPLIVMLGNVDENRATEVATLLQVVKMWREEFGCSVVIVHHWNKGGLEEGERFAQHMYGSFAFHAWLESALHVLPVIEAEQERIDTVVIEKEFKAAPSGKSLRVTFEIDSAETYTYNVSFQDTKSLTPLEQQLVDVVSETEQLGVTTPELVQMTGHARARVSEHLNRLVRLKILTVTTGGGRGKSSRYWAAGKEPSKT
jgi:RecA-family ATPase